MSELRSRAGPGWRRGFPVMLATAALASTAGAVWLTAVSRHAPHPVGHAVLSVVVCLSFTGAGLVALRRPPYFRFGLLLAAIGFAALLGSLHDANGAVPYTIGVLTANLVFAVLVHALLAFPHGRLRSRADRTLALAAYADVLGLQAVATLFDPLTRWHSAHPHNAALISSHAALATTLEEIEAAVAGGIALTVAVLLSRQARAATPAARRQLVPVLVGGKIALLFFSAGLVLAPLSSNAAVVGIGLGLLVALGLPAAFLAMLLQGQLSRAAVGELLVELREPGRPPGLEDALRRALGDPTLQLARAVERFFYVDAYGGPISLPGPGDARVSTPILHHGEPIGALVHDRSLRLRPELLDAVSAAAGFALANERALEDVQRMELRNRALLDAIPDPMILVSRYGTYLDVRAHSNAGLLATPEEMIGRNIRDFVPPDLADTVLACVEQTLDTGRMHAIDYEIEIDGMPRWKESRMVPSGDGAVVTLVRDFTEQRRAEAEQRRLAEEQAALRRVATLVASDAPPETVFQTVTAEACGLLGIRSALLLRYEEGDVATIVGKYGGPPDHFLLDTVLRLEEGAALAVLRTGEPAHIEYGRLEGGLAAQMRELGYRSSVGVPIQVAGGCWGVIVAAFREDEPFTPEHERRLQAFAELVGLGVASAHAREELSASRRRIVEASDAERRRIERNLHDGAQQRLVTLAVGLRLAQAKVRGAPEEAEALLGMAAGDVAEALTELRELAQGIHPAVLTERGLETALEVLAARTPLPVALEVRLTDRLPPPVEAAAYYVVSEAIANVVKHAGAETVAVRVAHSDGYATVEVEDNGAGGADPDAGTGLWGLRDRVETLSGRLEVDSPPDRGTLVLAELPLR
jgi:PAS domain S-box-containing protein